MASGGTGRMLQTRLATRILVIDSDLATRDAIVRLLGAAGYHVLEAEDGRQGLRLAREHRPGLILLGLSPDTGLDLLEDLRADETTRYIPVLALGAAAARAGDALAGAGGQRGAVNPEQLLEHIDRLAALAAATGGR